MKKKCKSLIFTLVELLVVIAIIAILASMLLPALNKARETAKSVKCVGQVKTITTAWLSYADDFEGFFPDDPYWMQNLKNNGYVGKNYAVFLCPSDQSVHSSVRHGLSYGVTGSVWASPTTKACGKKINTFKQPSRCLSIVELHKYNKTYEGGLWQYPTYPFKDPSGGTSSTYSTFPHNNKLSAGFIDGHVTSSREDELRQTRYNYSLATQ